MKNYILIVDFGSQYTQLIAKRIRSLGIYSEIVPFNKIPEITSNIKGLILAGGPSSVYAENSPDIDDSIFRLNIPVLGICYGFQLISKKHKGEIKSGFKKEYGRVDIEVSENEDSLLFNGILQKSLTTWMSHSDVIHKEPENFKITALSENGYIVALENKEEKIYGVQFHPEVTHTEFGGRILYNFLSLCDIDSNWNLSKEIDHLIEEVREAVKGEKIALAISGGVDSTVLAVLLKKAVGDNLIPMFMNNGLLRKNEVQERIEMFKSLGLDVHYIDAADEFLTQLEGVTDPSQKRKIIGRIFIEEFENFLKDEDVEFLAQGTLYPDVIESVPVYGKTSTIKLHHNVGGLPEKLNLKLVEPFNRLFKDEVREIGAILEVPEEIIHQHPFPGPGLAVRIPGIIDKKALEILREADSIYIEELKKNDIYRDIWQAFAVLLPVNSSGVKGDVGSYERVIALRAVTSVDGMTADWYEFEPAVLKRISNRITNEVQGVNRVLYDISSKPPATIEWE